MMIHLQHARERIFFERIMRSIKDEKVAIQQLLFPQTLRFQTADAALLLSILNDIRQAGFDIEDLGGGSFAVNGIPSGLEDSDLQGLMETLLEDHKSESNDSSVARSTRIASGMARQMALRAEKNLTEEGLRSIVDLLFACETPDYTPTGKKTFSLTTYEEIEKKFK
jgi:DNA mismatch repair protein MutL